MKYIMREGGLCEDELREAGRLEDMAGLLRSHARNIDELLTGELTGAAGMVVSDPLDEEASRVDIEACQRNCRFCAAMPGRPSINHSMRAISHVKRIFEKSRRRTKACYA